MEIKRRFIMSANPLTSKVAAPYARALFDFSVEKNIMHQITADFQNLDIFLKDTPELLECLNNPIVKQNVKSGILTKALKSQLNTETFKFLMVLLERNRINLLTIVIDVDSSLIGGFLIKTESKVIDFTVKNQLQKLAKHLGTVLQVGDGIARVYGLDQVMCGELLEFEDKTIGIA